jgi:hypothetical protein
MVQTPKELREARKKKLTFYFTGKPCPKGHIANRYTGSSKCVICLKNYHKIYGKKYFQKNKDRLRPLRKIHAENNREKYVNYQLAYRKKNPENYKNTLEKGKPKRSHYAKKYFQDNKNKILTKKYTRLKEDHLFRLKELVRARIQSGLRQHVIGLKKSMKSVMYLGCSFKEYKTYLESRFIDNMNWSNMGGKHGWQIDHIIPLASFDLKKKREQLKAFNYKNTQPLWAKANRVKGKNFIN